MSPESSSSSAFPSPGHSATRVRVAALQTLSTPDVDRNLQMADVLLREAAREGAQVAVLPEYFCLMGRRDGDKLGIAEREGHGPIQDFLARRAAELGLWVVGGTLPIVATDPARVRNACLVWNSKGERVARYDKIHLFRFQQGGESYDEGRVLEAGDTPVAVEAAGLLLGLSICYDLRFPELYRALTYAPGQRPLDAIVVPAAFTHTTGQAHWELLLRARAVENQCWVIAAAQGGLHENGRRTWGHSMVVDPWGQVRAVRDEDGPGVVVTDIDLDAQASVRERLPALTHRVL